MCQGLWRETVSGWREHREAVWYSRYSGPLSRLCAGTGVTGVTPDRVSHLLTVYTRDWNSERTPRGHGVPRSDGAEGWRK